MSEPGGIKYRLMLMNVSRELIKRRISLDQLRYALFDFIITRTNLDDAKNPFDLFMHLDHADHIRSDNLNVLIAMLELLEVSKVRNVIVKHKFPNPNVTPESEFLESRIRLLNIGKMLNSGTVTSLAGLYAVPDEYSVNQWKMLQYLQDNNQLDQTDNLTDFLELAGINLDSVKPPIVPALVEEPNIDNNQAIDNTHSVDPDKFLDLLTKVSRWYDAREKVNLVKVLLKEVLKKNYNVMLIKDFTEFFEKLHEAGKLRADNLTIIYELVHCTGQFGLEPEIRKFVPLCPNLKDLQVVEISSFRIKLKEFGNALLAGDLDLIDGLCNFPRLKYKDPWVLIMDLENQEKLTEKSLSNFIKKIEKHVSVHAVAKLR